MFSVIEGSGIDQTIIRMINSSTTPTISGASNAELRMLTVEASASPSTGKVTAMLNSNAHPRIYRVKFVVQNGGTAEAIGMSNVSSAPKIEECEFIVSINPPGGLGVAYGVAFTEYILGVRSQILRSRINVSGGHRNYGVRMFRGQTLNEIQDTRIDVVGGSETYGIYALGGGWQGNEVLDMRNVVIHSAGGAVLSAAIWLEVSTTVGVDIYNSKIWAGVSPTTYGIIQGGNPCIRWSSVFKCSRVNQDCSVPLECLDWLDGFGGRTSHSNRLAWLHSSWRREWSRLSQ